jgi:hypothetical protein
MLISLPYKYYKGTGNCQLYFWCCFLKHRVHKLYYCQFRGLEHPPVKYILESDVNSGWAHYIKVIWVLQNVTSSQALHCKTSILRAVLKVYFDIQAIYEQENNSTDNNETYIYAFKPPFPRLQFNLHVFLLLVYTSRSFSKYRTSRLRRFTPHPPTPPKDIPK